MITSIFPVAVLLSINVAFVSVLRCLDRQITHGMTKDARIVAKQCDSDTFDGMTAYACHNLLNARGKRVDNVSRKKGFGDTET